MLIPEKILAYDGFKIEPLCVGIDPGVGIIITLNEGIIFKSSLKLKKGEVKELEIINVENINTDASQRIKNGAIGVVVLGPIGLLGAAIGGSKQRFKLRLITNNNEQIIFETDYNYSKQLMKILMDIDLDKEVNKQYLKKVS